jgi:hypothetical protein
LALLIAGNLEAKRLKKLRPVEGVSLSFKFSGLRRQFPCLSHCLSNVKARHIRNAASASAILASLIGSDCCADASDGSSGSDSYNCCGYE